MCDLGIKLSSGHLRFVNWAISSCLTSQASKLYLIVAFYGGCERQIFTCVALAKAGLVVGPLRPSGRPSVRLSVRQKHFRVPSLCNL